MPTGKKKDVCMDKESLVPGFKTKKLFDWGSPAYPNGVVAVDQVRPMLFEESTR